MANEKRLIDANALPSGWMLAKFTEFNGKMRLTRTMPLSTCPTVDAVPVVRCKDCHWWRHINKRNGCGICQHEVFSVDDCTIDPVTEPTDFCSYGERREGECQKR